MVLNVPAVKTAARSKGYADVNAVRLKVVGGSKALVPRGTHRRGSGRLDQRQRLATSIKSTIFTTPSAVIAEVRYTASHSATQHQGSARHEIKARRKPYMVFKWARGQASPRLRKRASRAGFFFFKRVIHTGNKRPRRFLTTPLVMFSRRANFKVSIAPTSRTYLP